MSLPSPPMAITLSRCALRSFPPPSRGWMRRISSQQKIGIGRTPATNLLEVEGPVSKTTAGNWIANSDRRIKTDIQPVTGALEMMDRLNPSTFRYTPAIAPRIPPSKTYAYYNVIAQEFREVFPDAVKSSGEKLPDGAPSSRWTPTPPPSLHSPLSKNSTFPCGRRTRKFRN